MVTGRTGQLAASLAELAASAPGIDLSFASRPEFDLFDEASIRRAVEASAPDVIINAAAYTAVDDAETNERLAEQANACAPGTIADAARGVGARMIQISTDYVFDGAGDAPYREDDPTRPINTYGRTKLEGEKAVRAALPEHLIIRTSWVYSPFGRNFVKTMLALAARQERIKVVDDQVGTPTSALDIAAALLAVLRTWRTKPEAGIGATFHFAGRGSCSWAEFADHIFESSRRWGGPSAEVVGIPSDEWPTPAARPRNSRLDSSRFSESFAFEAPLWQPAVHHVIQRLLGSSGTQA